MCRYLWQQWLDPHETWHTCSSIPSDARSIIWRRNMSVRMCQWCFKMAKIFQSASSSWSCLLFGKRARRYVVLYCKMVLLDFQASNRCRCCTMRGSFTSVTLFQNPTRCKPTQAAQRREWAHQRTLKRHCSGTVTRAWWAWRRASEWRGKNMSYRVRSLSMSSLPEGILSSGK